jgi:branched-chain amino acid transport system substrate-binding protein
MANSNIHWSVAVCLALACSAGSALAQTTATKFSDGKVKIGVLTDIAGPTSKANGKGSVVAAEMAAEDFGAALNVEVISADHSGKPDIMEGQLHDDGGNLLATATATSKITTRPRA